MILKINKSENFSYSGKTAVKIEVTDESNNETFNATSWGHKLQGQFNVGTRIEVKENDAISWKEFRGNQEMSISFKADVAILSSGSTSQARQASTSGQGPHRAATSGSVASGAEVMVKAASLTKSYYDALIAEGFHEADALVICGGGGAASLYPMFWFGEKGI